MANKLEPVAMEVAHSEACEDTCSCGGAAGYAEAVRQALADLGADSPEDTIARFSRQLRGARKAGMSPGNAAGMLLALSGQQRSDPTSYTPRYQLEETRAEDYVAVDTRGKTVFGPTKDYGEAKLHAARAGGVVKFHVGASEPEDEYETDYGRRERGSQGARVVLRHQYGTPDGEFQVEFGRQNIGAVAFVGRMTEVESDSDESVRSIVRKDHTKGYWIALPNSGPVINTQFDDAMSAARAVLARFEGAAEKDPKFERCVQGVKHSSPDANPWAVCHAALGKEPEPYTNKNLYWHRDGAGYYTDVDPYGRIRVKQRTQDKRAGKLAWFAVVKKIEVAQGETRAEVNEAVEKHLRAPRMEAAAGEDCIRIVPRGDVDVIERDPKCAPKGVQMGSARQVASYMKERAARAGHEEFYVIGVSKQEELVGQPVMVASGQTDKVATSIPQVLAASAKLTEAGATSVWAYHAHPSGHGADPSPADKDLTKRIKKALDAADIPFKGHVVGSHTGSWARA